MNQATPDTDTLDWLLDPADPSVRFFTLTRLMGRPGKLPDVAAARAAIMTTGRVPRILDRQDAQGCWEAASRFYTAKYKGTSWQVLVLAELGADGTDDRIRRACEFLLAASQDLEGGGFSIRTLARKGGGSPAGVVPCLTGNLAWALIRLGYLDDPRVRRAVDWITTFQRFDDGVDDAPRGPPYDGFEICWGRHTCHMGAVKAMKALAEIPADRRSPAVTATLARGVEYLLAHHVHKRSHDLAKVAKPGWLRLGFPLMYQTDILEILGILAGLGVHDPRMREALDVLASKRDARGRWRLENTFNGKFQVDIEQKGAPSRWITLQALEVFGAVG